jgi:hypothetical protein
VTGISAEPGHHEHRCLTIKFPTEAAVDRPDIDRAAGSAARSVNVTPGRATAIGVHRVGGDQGATPGQKRFILAAPLRGLGPCIPSGRLSNDPTPLSKRSDSQVSGRSRFKLNPSLAGKTKAHSEVELL